MVVHELGWQFPAALISAKKGFGKNLVKRTKICKADVFNWLVLSAARCRLSTEGKSGATAFQ